MTGPEYRAEPYRPEMAEEWDDFVLNRSVNGTIWHTRRFLDYHPPDRFEDVSIAIRAKNRLVGVFPACVRDGGVFSHSGSTAGGPALLPKYYRVRYLLPLVDFLEDHYGGPVGMRLAESVFAPVEADALLYAFGRTADVAMELGVYRPLAGVDDFVAGVTRSSTRSAIRKLLRAGYETREVDTEEAYRTFHRMLAGNLEKHGVQPTHTVDEMLLLRERLGPAQKLFMGYEDGRPVAGSWVFVGSERAWHTFYIANTDDSDIAATPAALVAVMEAAAAAGARNLNFGICTEDGGRVANVGLFDFKESLGGRAINRYTLRPRATR